MRTQGKGVCLFTTPTATPQVLDRIQAGGGDTVRVQLSGVQDSAALATIAARGLGIQALATLGIVPGATHEDWQAPETSPRFLAYVDRYVAALAPLLPALTANVQLLEVCNEWASIGSKTRLSPAAYAVLYGAVYNAYQATYPGVIAVGGIFAWAPQIYGGATYANSGVGAVHDLMWDTEILPQPVTPPAICYHPYVHDIEVLDRYLSYLCAATPAAIYITEAGIQFQDTNPTQQPRWCERLYQIAAKYAPRVRGITWFAFSDHRNAAGSVETWGLQETPNAPTTRPVFDVWSSF